MIFSGLRWIGYVAYLEEINKKKIESSVFTFPDQLKMKHSNVKLVRCGQHQSVYLTHPVNSAMIHRATETPPLLILVIKLPHFMEIMWSLRVTNLTKVRCDIIRLSNSTEEYTKPIFLPFQPAMIAVSMQKCRLLFECALLCSNVHYCVMMCTALF